MNERVIVGLELQLPYHNQRIWHSFLEFVTDWKPTRIVGIGDHLDCPAPARWNRGTAEEYAGTLQRQCDAMKFKFQELRKFYSGRFDVHRGNHEARIDAYARTKAPAFVGLSALEVRNLLDYEAYDILELPPIARLAPGWITTHGDIGVLSKYSGGTAIALARRLGVSVVCGHTHRLGHLQESSGIGASKVLHGVETGHMMDIKKAAYIKSGAPNWQGGWAAFEINGGRVHPILVNASPTGVLSYEGT